MNQNTRDDDESKSTTIDGMTGEIIAPVETERMVSAITAAINQQVATAKQYPRRPISVIADDIRKMACLNDSMAKECMYSLNRGDKTITGPSIRFAEIVRAAYGNMMIAARFDYVDADDPSRAAVIVTAKATDLQNNNSEEIPVRRSIMTSGKANFKPRMFSADMINTTVMAAVAIARRNAILAVVPKPYWQQGYERAIEVIRGKADTFAQRLKATMDELAKLGATAAQVYEALDVRDHRDVEIDHMPVLIGFLTSIKEGESVASVLGKQASAAAERGASGVVDPLNDDPQKNEAQTGNGNGKSQQRATETAQPTQATTATATVETQQQKPVETVTKADPPQQEQQQQRTTPQGNNKLSNADYVDSCIRGMQSFKGRTQLDDWWKSQRTERSERKLNAEQLAKLSGAADARRADFT